MNSTERIIQNVTTAMEMNRKAFSDSTKDKLVQCLNGRTTFHETIQSLVSKYNQGE